MKRYTALEFQVHGNRILHRCRNVFLVETGGKFANPSFYLGTPERDKDDSWTPWKACLVPMEKLTGPRVKEHYFCPGCRKAYSREYIEMRRESIEEGREDRPGTVCARYDEDKDEWWWGTGEILIEEVFSPSKE